MTRIRYAFVAAVGVSLVALVCLLRPARAADPVPTTPTTQPTSIPRFTVSTHVLPGQISMTLLYVTDAQTNKLYIYRAFGGMDTSFNRDPELYRTYDLTSAGQKNLAQAK